jgi:cell division transport system permease protein
VLDIGNALRSHINSQREEIEILELVGATSALIRKPFLIEGTLLSITSMTIALGAASLVVHLLRNTTGEILTILDFQSNLWQLSFMEWLMALSFSVIIGLLGSYFCLSEINTGWAASDKKVKGLLRHV